MFCQYRNIVSSTRFSPLSLLHTPCVHECKTTGLELYYRFSKKKPAVVYCFLSTVRLPCDKRGSDYMWLVGCTGLTAAHPRPNQEKIGIFLNVLPIVDDWNFARASGPSADPAYNNGGGGGLILRYYSRKLLHCFYPLILDFSNMP